jgi:hypothetical protein
MAFVARGLVRTFLDWDCLVTGEVATSGRPRTASLFGRAVNGFLTVIAVLSFLLFLACAFAVFPNQRKEKALLKLSPHSGDASFLVVGCDAIRMTRQRMVATTQGVTVDATELDAYGVTTKPNSGSVIEGRSGNQPFAVAGNIKITFASKPPTRGGFGVHWGEYGMIPKLTSKLPASGPGAARGAGAAIVTIQGMQFSAHTQNLMISYWTMLAASAVLTCLTGVPMYRRIRRGRRLARNLCATCGYDVRASPDRCPECGTPITRDRTASPPPLPGHSTDTADGAGRTCAGNGGTSSGHRA